MRAAVLFTLLAACGPAANGADAAPDDVALARDSTADALITDAITADAPALDAVSLDAPALDVVAAPDAAAPDAIVRADVTPDAPSTDAAARAGIGVSTRWHIDLEAPVVTTVDADVFDIDLFDNEAGVIAAIHARGRRVICYFSAGSYEEWRTDASSFPAASLGSPLDGWPGERWIDTRNAALRTLMTRRLDLARTKGCDGVDPDNVDGYSNSSGFPLTSATQLDYNRFLAREARARGLLVGLKNDLDQVTALVGEFDFAINESCMRYSECDAVLPFARAGKGVLEIEYGAASTLRTTVCPAAATRMFYAILPGADRLTGSYERCSDGTTVR